MEISFKGKRALVTGAAQGIGRGIAISLSKCGATVVALDQTKESLELIQGEIPSLEVLPVDLSDWKATEEAIKTVFPIDLLVNNAGIAYIEALTSITEEQYDKMFAVNVKGLINVTRLVAQKLIERKAPGSIVNISSQASKAALLHHTLYCASKGAVDAFTRAAALEFGPKNIRINCVNPTVVMTDLGRKIWSNPEMGEPMLAKIPLNRFAEIEDVVNAVLFLLSDKANMITGSNLAVDEISFAFATIDLNFAELEYLADHLLPEECRRLVAAAHFKSYFEPNSLDQAERAVPKDIPCLQLLLHWNSAEGEGKGETHEVLEHRLRQMGKYELADWLGKTVFHQLGEDLEQSLHEGLQEILNETSTSTQKALMPTLAPVVKYSDPSEWLPFDTICLALLIGLIAITIALSFYIGCKIIISKCKKHVQKRKLKKAEFYEMVENQSDSESEDKFDIRKHETAM